MAAPQPQPPPLLSTASDDKKLQSCYLGLAFFLHTTLTLPNSIINQNLVLRLLDLEQQLEQMKSRRKEDAKANARVVEIFASHRHTWQQEERRLHRQIHDSAAEVAELRERVKEMEEEAERVRETVEELRREVSERNEMVEFMSRGMFGGGENHNGDENEKDWFGRVGGSREEEEMEESGGFCLDENGGVGGGGGIDGVYGGIGSGGGDVGFKFDPEMLGSSAAKFWSEGGNHLWQV